MTVRKKRKQNDRTLDLALWSDHRTVMTAVDELLAELKVKRQINRVTDPRKRAARVLILNLYLRWLEDPPGEVSYSRNKARYTVAPRYNPSKVGYEPLISLIEGLSNLGYLRKTAKGFYPRPGRGKGRQSRLQPTSKLIDLLRNKFGIEGGMIDSHGKTETVVLRDQDKRDVDYNETSKTKGWRRLLTDYNGLLRRKHISIDLSEYAKPIRINLARKFTRRIFNNASFKEGGRFYGGWWQSIPKELRPRILVRSKPTIELDFAGCQVVIVYANCGIDYFATGRGDPYTTRRFGAGNRDIFKKVLLAALNADSRPVAKRAVQSGVNDGELVLPAGATVEDILKELETYHADIGAEFYSGRGTHYQYLDSLVAEKVIEYFTRVEREPVLCVHDSFIVEEGFSRILENKMAECLEQVLLEETALTSVTPKMTRTDAWRTLIKASTDDFDEVREYLQSPEVERDIAWYRTKRQEMLVYEPK